MKKLIYALTLCAVLLLIVACDSRIADKPDIMVDVQTEKIYDLPNYETCSVSLTLSGKNSQIQNTIVDLVYDHDILTILTNTGVDTYFRTNETGFAQGTIVARSVGATNIQFKVRNWSTSMTKTMYVSSPEITSLIAIPESLPADGTSISNLTAIIYPPLNGKYVRYTTNGYGSFNADSTMIDADGYSRNSIKSSIPGVNRVTAKLINYPNQQKSINVTFE